MTDLVKMACPTCGILFGISQELHEAAERIRDRGDVAPRVMYCPEGHQWHLRRPEKAADETAMLKRRVKELEQKLEAAERVIRDLGGNVTAFPKSKGAA